METLEITVSHEQARVPVTVMHLNGRANLGTVERLLAKAQQIIASGARYLLLDLSNVPSMTSAGLRVIHQIYRLLHETAPAGSATHSPYLKLLAPTPDVLRVLRIAGYDSLLEIHDNLKDAAASFGERSA